MKDKSSRPKKAAKREEGSAGSAAQKRKDGKSVNIAPDFGMMKNTLKNFGTNLIYIFVTMGTVYLFMLFAILLFAGSTLQNLSTTLSGIVETVGASIEQSSASVEEFLAYAFGSIDWNGNFFQTITVILDSNWISNTIKGFFETLSTSTEGFDAQINVILTAFSDKLSVDIGIAVSLVALGVWISNSATRYVLRRRTAKRGIKNFLLAHTLVPLLQSVVVFVAGILFAFIQWFAILVLVAAVALWAVVSLVNSYLIFREKDVLLTLKDIITPRNVISLILVGLIILLIDVLVGVGLWFLNPILCVLIMIPVLIYSLNIVDLGSDSFVTGLIGIVKGAEKAVEIKAE